MPKGRSLHVGLNGVDAAHYAGWAGTLAACEFDAHDMAAIAKKKRFEPTLLLTKQATSKALLAAIRDAAADLKAGDIFVVSYSGHGGQVPDKNNDEPDMRDETWCLYDRQVIDDELYTAWADFAEGVRVFVLSDSCHSGSAARQMAEFGLEPLIGVSTDGSQIAQPAMRVIPKEFADRTYAAHKKLYDGIQKKATATEKSNLAAHVLLISGCQDNQTSSDGDRNGLFTQTLRKVWDDGHFTGTYHSFWKKIVAKMPLYQSPNYFWAGSVDKRFERQQPFTI
jgi:hypothetical protein